MNIETELNQASHPGKSAILKFSKRQVSLLAEVLDGRCNLTTELNLALHVLGNDRSNLPIELNLAPQVLGNDRSTLPINLDHMF